VTRFALWFGDTIVRRSWDFNYELNGNLSIKLELVIFEKFGFLLHVPYYDGTEL